MKYFITLLLIAFWTVDLSAQNQTIRVLDRTSGEAVIQAHIKTGEQTVIATTNTEGYFTINSLDHPSIIITAVGYDQKEVILDPEMQVIYLSPAIFEHETGLLVIANPDGR